jgi:hypothetical protein
MDSTTTPALTPLSYLDSETSAAALHFPPLAIARHSMSVIHDLLGWNCALLNAVPDSGTERVQAIGKFPVHLDGQCHGKNRCQL